MAEIRINATGELKLYDSDDSNYVSFKSAGTVSSNVAWVLPSADGSSGQVLSTNGSGTLSWATASSADPSSADGDSLGTASAEWSDLYLADGGIVYFGNDQDIRLTHNADKGLILKHSATADDKPVILTLQTGETDIAQDDVLGKIEFQAPDEGTGTDAVLVSGAIQAVAEGDHSSSSNATRLEFMTGASEAAATKMWLTSGGKLGLGTAPDLGTLHVRTADSSASVSSDADELVLENSTNAGLSILTPNDATGYILFGDPQDSDAGRISYNHNGGSMDIRLESTDFMNCSTSGVGFYCNADNTRVKIETTTDSENTLQLRHGDADNPSGVKIDYYGGSPNGSGDDFIHCRDSANPRFVVQSDGDCTNDDNAYGAISDERIKQDITDANSQWDDIKALKVRKYRKKEDVRAKGESAHYEIGLVAQEAELVSPKLIKEINPGIADITSDASFGTIVDDTDNQKFYLPKDTLPAGKKVGDPVLDESGNPTYYKKVGKVNSKVKSMKYSILYMKAIKALQEAQTRIETLETKVKALEG